MTGPEEETRLRPEGAGLVQLMALGIALILLGLSLCLVRNTKCSVQPVEINGVKAFECLRNVIGEHNHCMVYAIPNRS